METKALKDDLFRMCWYMRGSLSVTESYDLDITDREIISNIINSNLDVTKESGLPFFQ